MRALVGAVLFVCMAAGWAYERVQHMGWHDYAKRLESASDAARTAQDALRAHEQAQARKDADDAQSRYLASLDRVRGAADAFVRAHGVQPGDQCAALPEREADRPHLPESLPAQAVVPADDVRACGDLYAYAVSARQWALTVGQ